MDHQAKLTKFRDLTVRVKELAVNDPEFAAAAMSDPIGAVRARFGADFMPEEGQYVRDLSDDTREVVFPVSALYWTLGSAKPADGFHEGELSDEMLASVSGGSCVGPSPAPKLP